MKQVKVLLKFIYLNVIGFLSIFIPPKNNQLTFVRRSFSGSNITPVYLKMKETFPDLDIKLINTYNAEKENSMFSLLKEINSFTPLIRSKIVVTTHGPIFRTIFKSKKTIAIELWHGFPTKKEGLLLNKRNQTHIRKFTDYFVSYSNFCTVLLNSRYGMPSNQFVVLGTPRNDYFFSPLNDPYHNEFENVIFYAPTYRESNEQELALDFRLSEFSLPEFNIFLQKINAVLIWKLHPKDETLIGDFQIDMDLSNILILMDSEIRDMQVDFYQLLAISDMLITDYSSIYADYLLLNKPMIFVPTDLQSFQNERGLLLTPYETWMPGPKCHNQNELQLEIINCLEDDSYYARERNFMKDIIHHYQDGNSTDRVVNFILSLMEQ